MLKVALTGGIATGKSYVLRRLQALGVPLLFFLIFERWFLVLLPKGPLERALGL